MADKPISQLTEATTVGANDLMYLVQNNESKKVKAGKFISKPVNVEISGLPHSEDTSEADGELILYKKVYYDDLQRYMEEPYFTIDTNGLLYMTQTTPQGSYYSQRMSIADLQRVKDIIPSDSRYDFEFDGDGDNEPQIYIIDNTEDLKLVLGTKGIFLADTSGNPIAQINVKAMQQVTLLGYDEDGLIGQDIYEFKFVRHTQGYVVSNHNLSYDAAIHGPGGEILKKASYYTDKIVYEGYDGDPIATVLATELAHLSGVTSNIQNQIDGKADTITFDDTTRTLSLKSGNTVLSTAQIPGGGGSSIHLADVSGATATISMNTATITWTDPSDIVVSGATLAAWAGTKVVRKAGSAPQDENDGTLVVNSTARNQYSSSGYVDTGLTYDTVYYYRFFPYSTDSVVTNGSSVSVTPVRTKITTVPTQNGTLTYNGNVQTASFNDFNTNQLTVTDNTGTNAGTYTAYFTPKEGYCWNDDSLTAKAVSWTIDKATGSISLSSNSVSLDTTTTYTDITITPTGDGALSVASGDTSIATVGSISGNVFRITAVDGGNTTVTVSMASSTNYTSATATVSVAVVFTQIFGVEWDGTSTTSFSRTDDAQNFSNPNPYYSGMSGTPSSPFDNIMPWSGMTIVEDSDVGTLVRIPKFWYKWTRDGAKMKLQIANGPSTGFNVSPAHRARNSQETDRDYVYVARYHCGASDYKSKTGVSPEGNHTRSEFRASIHNLGTDIWQFDFAMFWTIRMLYLVEFADWNSQDKIGYGCGNNSSVGTMGYTDSMPYHTGTTQTSRTTYGLGTQYRHIEGLWDNVYDWCDGVYFNSSSVYGIFNPADFSDSSGGTLIGTRPASGGYISAWNANPNNSDLDWAIYPSAKDGTDSTYVCDRCYYNSSGVVLYVGGYYNQSLSCGMFFLLGNNAASVKSASIGSRLQKLP